MCSELKKYQTLEMVHAYFHLRWLINSK